MIVITYSYVCIFYMYVHDSFLVQVSRKATRESERETGKKHPLKIKLVCCWRMKVNRYIQCVRERERERMSRRLMFCSSLVALVYKSLTVTGLMWNVNICTICFRTFSYMCLNINILNLSFHHTTQWNPFPWTSCFKLCNYDNLFIWTKFLHCLHWIH